MQAGKSYATAAITKILGPKKSWPISTKFLLAVQDKRPFPKEAAAFPYDNNANQKPYRDPGRKFRYGHIDCSVGGDVGELHFVCAVGCVPSEKLKGRSCDVIRRCERRKAEGVAGHR